MLNCFFIVAVEEGEERTLSLVEAVVTLPAPLGFDAAFPLGTNANKEKQMAKATAIFMIFLKKFTSYERLSFTAGISNDCVNLTIRGVKFHCINIGSQFILTGEYYCATINSVLRKNFFEKF